MTTSRARDELANVGLGRIERLGRKKLLSFRAEGRLLLDMATREAAMDETRRIAGAVRIPVSVDAENGYGHTPEEVVGTTRRVAETGAVGASIEDKESCCSDGSTPVSIQPARQLLGKKFNFLQKSLGPSGCPFGIHLKADSANRGNNRLTKLRAEGLVQIEIRHYPLAHRYPAWGTKIAAPGLVVFSSIGAIRLLFFS